VRFATAIVGGVTSERVNSALLRRDLNLAVNVFARISIRDDVRLASELDDTGVCFEARRFEFADRKRNSFSRADSERTVASPWPYVRLRVAYLPRTWDYQIRSYSAVGPRVSSVTEHVVWRTARFPMSSPYKSRRSFHHRLVATLADRCR